MWVWLHTSHTPTASHKLQIIPHEAVHLNCITNLYYVACSLNDLTPDGPFTLLTTQRQLTEPALEESAFFHSIPEEWPKSGQSPADLWGLRGHLGSLRGKNKASLLCYAFPPSMVLTREYKRFDMGSACLDSSIFCVCWANKRPSHTFTLCTCWCKDLRLINNKLWTSTPENTETRNSIL